MAAWYSNNQISTFCMYTHSSPYLVVCPGAFGGNNKFSNVTLKKACVG